MSEQPNIQQVPEETLVISRCDRKTDMIREHVEAGCRVIAVDDYRNQRLAALKKAMLAPAFISLNELGRILPDPEANWLNIGIPSLGEDPVERDPYSRLYGSSWDEVRRGVSYHPKDEYGSLVPKVGKPGARVLKARRERNKTAAKSRRRNRG